MPATRTTPRTAATTQLEKLQALIYKNPLTAKRIAKALKCTKPTAYNRLDTLENHGATIAINSVRESKTGPASATFSVTKKMPASA